METAKSELEYDDRMVIDDLSNKMTVTSWGFFFWAAQCVYSRLNASSLSVESCLEAILSALIPFALGLFTSQSAKAFKIVGRASTDHLNLLMDAIHKLRRQYNLIYWIVFLGVVAVLFF